MSSRHCSTWSIARRSTAVAAAFSAAVLFLLCANAAATASTPIQMLKEMPVKGTLRQGDVVYVDNGRCPPGEVKKITGGNQSSGVPRHVECVKRPVEPAKP